MEKYENYVFITANTPERLTAIEDEMLDIEILQRNELIGYILDINARECTSKNGSKFTLIEFIVKGSDNKKYKKTFSVDFMRNYLKQLNCKIQDLMNVVVIIKPTGEYNNIGKFFPIGTSLTEEDTFILMRYINEPEVKSWDVFDKLGI